MAVAIAFDLPQAHVASAQAAEQAQHPHQARARMTEDSSLVERAAKGDSAAFKQLFRAHRGDVARLVYRMMSGRGDLDDVVQEVFFQVFRSLPDFRGDAKFTTWLHRVTVNVVLMQRRSQKSRPVFAEEAPPDHVVDTTSNTPDEDVARLQRVRAFRRLLDRVADKKRVVFVLHDLEGMSPAEISQVVDAPVLTVRTRLFYARKELAAMMDSEPSLASLKGSFTSDDRAESREPKKSNDAQDAQDANADVSESEREELEGSES
jgi:RNA polymerase sigma-70 factor (ECF subfamily)